MRMLGEVRSIEKERERKKREIWVRGKQRRNYNSIGEKRKEKGGKKKEKKERKKGADI